MTMFTSAKIINLQHLGRIAGVGYWKIYNRQKIGPGRTASPLSAADRTKLSNALQAELIPIFEELGFNIKVTRKRPIKEEVEKVA